jgi:hypothetical protein
VLIVVRTNVAVLLPRGQDVVDSAQQCRCHGDYRERKEMSSRPGRIGVSALAASASSGIGFDAQSVVHSDPELLLTAKIALRRLDRHVAEQELNLIEFPAG